VRHRVITIEFFISGCLIVSEELTALIGFPAETVLTQADFTLRANTKFVADKKPNHTTNTSRNQQHSKHDPTNR
jgi:hypothetical protein